MATNKTNLDKGKEFKDLGFGNKVHGAQRLVNKDGSFNLIKTGGGADAFHLYQYLLSISWQRFWLWIFIFYLTLNSVFAFTYLLVGIEGLTNLPDGANLWQQYLHAFFFSVQTSTSLGYGTISPVTTATNVVASIEAVTGLLALALATGLLFGRFSRPSAKIKYSTNALIAPYKDGTALMFRMVNARNNQLIELEAQVSFAWVEMVNGSPKRSFQVLPLERNKINFFPLNWTLVHPINEASPLYQLCKEELLQKDAEILIILKAFDDTFSQTVYTRHSYTADEIICNAKFTPAFHINEEGKVHMDVQAIDNYETVA